MVAVLERSKKLIEMSFFFKWKLNNVILLKRKNGEWSGMSYEVSENGKWKMEDAEEKKVEIWKGNGDRRALWSGVEMCFSRLNYV